MVRVDFSRLPELTNRAYYPYLHDFRRFQVLKGGAGAGKSVHISEKIVYNTLLHRGYNGLACRKVGRDNHDSTFAEVNRTIARWNLGELFEVNRSRGAEEITCTLNGNRLIFRGMDDVEKVKSITFPTGDLVYVWYEEANQGSVEDLRQLNLRLRGKTGEVPKHIMMSFNPIDVDCWLKTEFFDTPMSPERGYVLETTYRDNRFLDDEYKAELERLKDVDMYYYRVYVLNEWGSRNTARVFQNLCLEDFDIPDYQLSNLRYGVDFGFNHASAYEGMGFKDGELYIYKEAYGKGLLNKEFIDRVKEVHVTAFPIVGDSASPDKIQEMNEAGLTVYGAEKGPGSLLRGVDWLKALPKIHIHQTRCPNAAREFVRFKYRELKDGTVVDEVVELDDDTIAATRYAVEDLAKQVEGGHFVLKRR
jgi:phage terminase large subunit